MTPARAPAPDRAPRVLRLPDVDQDSLPGARLVRRAVRLTLGGLLLLAACLLIALPLVTLDVVIRGTGTIEPVRVWPVRPRVGGRVEATLVGAGDSVAAGQPLVRLDTQALAVERRQLEVQLAEQRLERERAQRLHRIVDAEGEAAQIQATARALRARAALREQLAQSGFGASADSVLQHYTRGTHVALDRSVAEIEAAAAEMATARAQRARAELLPLDATKARLAEERLRTLLRQQRDAIGRSVVEAPAAGVVLTEQPERLVGSVVREGDLLLEVADVAEWRATVIVAERDVHRIRRGDSADVEIPALAALRLAPIRAAVLHVADAPLAPQDERGAARSASTSGYRVVLAIGRDAPPATALAAMRRGYAVKASIITRRTSAWAMLRDWVQEQVIGTKVWTS